MIFHAFLRKYIKLLRWPLDDYVKPIITQKDKLKYRVVGSKLIKIKHTDTFSDESKEL